MHFAHTFAHLLGWASLVLMPLLSAQEEDYPLVPTPAEQIAAMSGLSNALLAELVSPLSKQISMRVTDLFVRGAQDLMLERLYLPSELPPPFHHSTSEDYFELLKWFEKTPFQDWLFLHHRTLRVIHTTPRTHKNKGFRHKRFIVPDSSGVVLQFFQDIKVDPTPRFATSLRGMNNVCNDRPLGEYDYKNTTLKISQDEKTILVTMPNGTKRRYLLSSSEPVAYYKLMYGYDATTVYYHLVEEVLPGGKRIVYEWENFRLKKFSSCPPMEGRPYASITSTYPNEEEISFAASVPGVPTVQVATYRYTNFRHMAKPPKRYQGPEVKGERDSPFYLASVHSPYFKEECVRSYRLELTSYEGKEVQFEPVWAIGRMPFRLNVSALRFPLGEEQGVAEPFTIDVPLYDSSDQTLVRCCDGSFLRYTYVDLRLHTIEFLDASKRVQKKKVYTWNPEGQLIELALYDCEGRLYNKREFSEYDPFGNPQLEVWIGNLTGKGSEERYEIRRRYDRHLLMEEEEGGKTTAFKYVPGTNLVKEKTISSKEGVLKRERCAYDERHNLIKKIVDDGDEGTYFLAKTFKLRQEDPYRDLPQECVESTLDGGEERILKTSRYTYDNWGNIRVTEILDANGQTAYCLHKTYDERGNLLKESDPIGREALYTYDERSRLISKRDFGSSVGIEYTHDRKGRLLQKKECAEGVQPHLKEYRFDALDQLTEETDDLGNATTYCYDSTSRLPTSIQTPPIASEEDEPIAIVECTTYDAFGNALVKRDGGGHTTHATYNARGQPLTITHADGSAEQFFYTLAGDLKTHINQEGLKIEYTRDLFGRAVKTEYFGPDDTLLAQERATYTPFYKVSETDKEGNFTAYTYDCAGRTTSENRCGRITGFHYDALGRIDQIIKHNEEATRVTHFERDLLDRILKEEQRTLAGELLSTLSYAYDAAGNRVSVTRSIGGEEALEKVVYDPFHRPIKSTDGCGHQTTTHYDETYTNALGQRVLKTTTTTPRGISTISVYDPYERLSEQCVTNEQSETLSVVNYWYDPCGKRTLQKEALYDQTTILSEHSTRTTYNPCHFVDTLTRAPDSPNKRTTRTLYTPSGKLRQKILPSGLTLDFTYTPLGYLHTLTSSDGTIHHTFRTNALGHLLEATDLNHHLTVRRILDPFGNILSESFPSGHTVEQTYDAFDRPLTLTFPSGTVSYRYNPLHLIQVIRTQEEGGRLEHSYDAYDLSGHLLQETLCDGTTVRYSYDLNGQEKGRSSPYLAEESLYDSSNNLVQTTQNGLVTRYTYDGLDQLASSLPSADAPPPLSSSELPLGMGSYRHDSNYNPLEKNGVTICTNDLNEIVTQGTLLCRYDLDGNLIQKGEVFYTYDPLSRLTTATTPLSTIRYTYDPLGRRWTKTTPTTTETILYADTQEIGILTGPSKTALTTASELSTLTTSGTSQGHDHTSSQPLSTIWKIPGRSIPKERLPILIELNHAPTVPLLDRSGNMRYLIDPSSKTLLNSYFYSPFGETSTCETLPNPYRYLCKQWDPDLALYHFDARDYDPALSRWLTPDPLGLVDSTNPYQYLFNNPFRYRDPTGQFAFMIVLPLLELSLPLLTKLVADAVVISTVAWLAVETNAAVQHKIKENESKRHTEDQEALSDLAKDSGRQGIANEEADTLLEWAEEYDFPHRDDRGERHWKAKDGVDHIHLGREHIPISD